jgi:hypothetical protein
VSNFDCEVTRKDRTLKKMEYRKVIPIKDEEINLEDNDNEDDESEAAK